MNPNKLEQTHDPDLIHSFAALKRAAQRAREIASRTGTMLVIVRNERCERVSPGECDATAPASDKASPRCGP